MRSLIRCLAPLALLFAACESTTAVPAAPLSAIVRGAQLELHNRGSEPVYYIAVEAGALARTTYAPCTNPARCVNVPPRSTRTIPLGEIHGYSPEAEAVVVIAWHLRRAPAGSYRMHPLETLRVPLR